MGLGNQQGGNLIEVSPSTTIHSKGEVHIKRCGNKWLLSIEDEDIVSSHVKA